MIDPVGPVHCDQVLLVNRIGHVCLVDLVGLVHRGGRFVRAGFLCGDVRCFLVFARWAAHFVEFVHTSGKKQLCYSCIFACTLRTMKMRYYFSRSVCQQKDNSCSSSHQSTSGAFHPSSFQELASCYSRPLAFPWVGRIVGTSSLSKTNWDLHHRWYG